MPTPPWATHLAHANSKSNAANPRPKNFARVEPLVVACKLTETTTEGGGGTDFQMDKNEKPEEPGRRGRGPWSKTLRAGNSGGN